LPCGLISAAAGVYIRGGAGTVTNSGTVTGASSIGISLVSGGGVQNGSASNSTARIGGTYGVKIAGGAGTVNNHAYITGSTGGVFLGAGGYVYNAGSTSGATGTINANYAVALTNTSGSGVSQRLTNAGLVEGGKLGVGLAGGKVINSGTIKANYYAIQDNKKAAAVYNLAGGSIRGSKASAPAIQFNSAAGTVSNYGTISAPAAGTAISFAYGYDNELLIGQHASFTGTVNAGNFIGSSYQSSLLLVGYSAALGTIDGIGSQFVGFGFIDVLASWVFAASDTIAAGTTLLIDDALTNRGRILTTPTIDPLYYLANASGGAITGASVGVVGNGLNQLVNDGTITQTSTGNYAAYEAVVFKVGGSVTNQTAGLISGQHGVLISSATGTIVNMGVIEGTNFGFGIKLAAGGSVTNDSGTITGQQGVYIHGGAGTVTNFATIATTSPVGGSSVLLPAGFTNLVKFGPGATFAGGIVDGGNTIGATSVGTLELLSAKAGGTITPGVITNLGSNYVNFAIISVDQNATWSMASGGTVFSNTTINISGTLTTGAALGTGVVLSNASTGTLISNVALATGDVVTNSGSLINNNTVTSGAMLTSSGSMTNNKVVLDTPTLTGTGAYLNNASGALISNAAAGVVVSSTAGRVVNSGTIKSTSGTRYGLGFTAGGTVTNQSGATIQGATALFFENQAGTVVNQGQLLSPGSSDPTVELQKGGMLSNLGGTISGGHGVSIFGGAGTVTNTGRIVGAVSNALSMAAGYTNRLAIGPTGTFVSGTVDGGNHIGSFSSVSTLELMSGSSTGSLAGALGTQYVNFGALIVDASATWAVSGNLTGQYALSKIPRSVTHG
jgi:hypothetical protein